MFVVPHAAGDSVGEVAFVGSSGFSGGFAFGAFPGDVDLGVGVVPVLGDRHDVEHAVDGSVASKVEAVTDGFTGCFTRGQRDRAGAAPASEFGF